MVYKVYRIRQKTDEGYDIFHIETNTDLVLRFKGSNCTTLEQELTTLGEKIAANAVGLTVLDDVQASVDSVDNVDAGTLPQRSIPICWMILAVLLTESLSPTALEQSLPLLSQQPSWKP